MVPIASRRPPLQLVESELRAINRSHPVAILETARRQRAADLHAVLDAARFGADGSPLVPEAIDAAESLLELGYPYALELTPEELAAFRRGRRADGFLLAAFVRLSVPWVVLCALINGLAVLFAVLGSGWCGLTLVISSSSTVVAIYAGYDVFRLKFSGAVQLQAARRLSGWSACAFALGVLDLCGSGLPDYGFHDQCLHGWINAGWIIPVTLPLALIVQRRLSR